MTENFIETQTIDIRHVRQILEACPNYDYIVNYEYEYGDTLSSNLIDWYRELIFTADGNRESELKIIKKIDYSLYLYLSDSKYKKGLIKIITPSEVNFKDKNLVKQVIKKIINFTNTYENNFEIANSKWL